MKTTHSLTQPFVYRVVADGCIDIFFELNRPHESFVMGFYKQYTEFPLDPEFHYIGIRFLPTAFPQLFGIDAATLSDRVHALPELLPTTATFLRHSFASHPYSSTIANLLDGYFQDIIANVRINDDHRLYDALALIFQHTGLINVETELNTGLSPRQMRRLFKYYIGTTPKTFSQVVRFQNILRAKPSQQSLRQNPLFFDVGYYDQAHFIKEFKHFYGLTPSQAFGR